MAMLPYVTATGNVEKALMAIKAAATPSKVTQDFVKTILKVPGGSGDQMTSFLKKIGFVNADSTPSDIYTRFRNSSTAGAAAAAALRYGYAPLFKRNEFWHALGDNELRGLIVEETGLANDSPTVTMILNSMKGVRKFATFESEEASPEKPEQPEHPHVQLPTSPIPPQIPGQSLGLNIGYTINLNLPATSDVAVFNAIFKSLKDNLLKASDG
ncbi:hypothetical protein J2W51_004818 [Tardiphaga robiniae]|uniref:DUF5343 domain-containing protein n=1 Tax=Tardiphaga robiniae TaxID=943830 RepID=UPI002866E598|nr:DUF5343 domain-containing protein [Tardiphaga robiniae]MDR6662228.1 hypothetical protein [Tardiphaga robiniae]